MEVKTWNGGLHAQEVKAIERIKQAFQKPKIKDSKPVRGGSLQDQLKSIGGSSMFPWKGYAGFRYVDTKGNEGEFDLVIVTHCNVLIVELKDWNGADIKSHADKWYKGSKDMGRSPVSVTQNKVFLLKDKLDKVKHKLTSKKLPWVDFFVVMCGNAKFHNISEKDKKHTISLEEFLKFANEDVFNKRFRPFENTKTLNLDFRTLDGVFSDESTAPKQVSVGGYKASELIDEHPKKIYKEFHAVSESSRQDTALLRIWNFDNFEGVKGRTPEGRFEIVSREKQVLQYIKHKNNELYKNCLRALSSLEKDNVTTEYSELYEIPSHHSRFNEFIIKYADNYSEIDRVNIVKLLIAKFADLHKIKVAHRDLGDHSIWLSPSKEVALSNFISAYYQPAGTVGDYRQQLSVNDLFDTYNPNQTPFQSDVNSLAVMAWHILNGKRISVKSCESLNEEIANSTAWYSAVLQQALREDCFTNADEFFDKFFEADPNCETSFDFDVAELEPYIKQVNHTRVYRDDFFILENDEKEVYESDGHIVKAWLNILPSSNNPALCFKVLNFLKQLEELQTISPEYIPTIRDFGLAHKSASLYLVTDKIDGKHWGSLEVESHKKIELIESLIKVIEHLHGLGISHGDLHPENVLLQQTDESIKIYLIDIPDFSADINEVKNNRYSPEYIDNSTPFERDNFAVIRMASELLGISWGKESEDYSSIADCIVKELNDREAGFKTLSRFKKALHSRASDTGNLIEVTINKPFEELTIYPDNGKLYVQVSKAKEHGDLFIEMHGIGGIFKSIFRGRENTLGVGFEPKPRSSVIPSIIDSSQFVVDFPIRIKSGTTSKLNSLTVALQKNEAFQRTKSIVLKPEETTHQEHGLTEQLKAAFKSIDDSKSTKDIGLNISTVKLWQAIIDTETESYPCIEMTGEIVEVKETNDQLIIPYSSDVDILGKFRKDDTVEALKIEGEKEIFLGEVILKNSAMNEVRVGRVRPITRALKDGEVVYFRTKQDKASYTKRKAALERLLDNEGVISRLTEYFDPNCSLTATEYPVKVTDSDFARYDREDDHGNKISLNLQQRNAFQNIIQNGPLSMLQGPPGTGKTEFIAAFVHYLLEKQNVKRILLVSQSHEAVNTAAERIRSHCSRLDTSIQVVRFSNSERAVSDGLKDVYSNALVSEKRALFHAELKQRVEVLSTPLGLDAEYLSTLVIAQVNLFKQIDAFANAMKSFSSQEDEEDKRSLKMIISELDQSIRRSLIDDYRLVFEEKRDIREAKQEIINKLNHDFSVRPHEARKAVALANISIDMLDVLDTEKANYEEFFARSRQLVTGTCVGIGQRYIGIAANQYDWVIIDEAARSIASELAIAMQSGKRILLVGDHRQLPPLYQEPHKKALAQKLGIDSRETDLDAVLQSDFARAFESSYGKQAGAALLTQYRMAAPIGDLVSSSFYDGDLKNGERAIPDIYGNAPRELQNTVTWLDTSNLGSKCYHQDDKGVSIYNRCEADIIINLLKDIAQRRHFKTSLQSVVKENEAAIGVICMYGEQKRLIRKKFNELEWDEDFKKLVKIDTVDSYQGKENRIIILSITRSSRDMKPRFLKTPNRINVALSRAMDRLLIIGSKHMWQNRNSDLPLGKVLSFIESKGLSDGYSIMISNVQ